MKACIKYVKVNGETFPGSDIERVVISGNDAAGRLGSTIMFKPKSPDAVMGEVIVTTAPVTVLYGEVKKEVEK